MSFTLTGVGFRHPTARPADRDALVAVDATLPGGGVSAVLGMSGSGKTTLLNLLGRLWDGPPTRGEITYTAPTGEAFPYHALTGRQLTHLRRRHFGFVLQNAYLLGHLSLSENVGVPLALQGKDRPTRRKAVAALLDRTGLGRLADRPARRLSGGEKQRAAVLRAVVHGPSVLFADEPFSSLDPDSTDAIVDLFDQWHAGQLTPTQAAPPGGGPPARTLVLVTHDHALAWRLVTTPRPVAGGFLRLSDGGMTDGGLRPPSAYPGGAADLRSPRPAAPAGAGTP